jgi:lauroyl/myristoyl acyltransferase
MDDLKKQLIKRRLEDPSEKDYEYFSYHFSIFKANIHHFLPYINENDYENLFKKFLYNAYLAETDQSNYEKIKKIIINNVGSYNIIELNCKPTIFAAFHFGSYRMITSYLLYQGFKVVLIVEDTVYNTQRTEIDADFEQIKLFANKNESNLILLNVSDVSSIFRLKKMLKEGYVLVVYMDGNTGLKKNVDLEKECFEIDFLKSSIFVRKGILELAYIMNASVVPVVSKYVENDRIILNFFNKIEAFSFKNRSEFVKTTLKLLYAILEDFIYKNPEQWECWLYMHKWFLRNKIHPYEKNADALQYKFNHKRYSLFKMNENSYIFDLYSYRIHPISMDCYNNLKIDKFRCIKETEIEKLSRMNVII